MVAEVVRQLRNDAGRADDQLRQVVNDALHQRAQHFARSVQHGRHGVGQALGQLSDDLHTGLHQPGQLLGNARRQIGDDLACGLQHGFGAALVQSRCQLSDDVGTPLRSLRQGRFQRIKQADTEVFCGRLQGVHLVLEGVRHGLVGGLGRACAVLHLAEHIVEMICTAGCQRQSAGACFYAGPQARERGAAAANALVKDLQHVAQALALGVQLGKALAGLLLQNFADGGARVAQLIEHGLGVGGGFCRGNTVGGHDGQSAGKVLHADVVGCGQRDDLAHAGGQLVHAGFAQILGRQQDVRHMGGLIGAQAVSVQGGGQDIHGGRRGGKTCSGQLGGLPSKGNGVCRILTGADGLISRFGDVRGSNAHIAGCAEDLLLQLIHRHSARVCNGADLCKRRLKGRADADRILCQIRQLTTSRFDQVGDQFAGSHRHAGYAAGKTAGVKLGIAKNTEICCHLCPPLNRSAGTRAQAYNFISISRRQAGFLHLTQTPWAFAVGSAHTGSARPQ